MIPSPETDTAIAAFAARRPPPDSDLETLRAPVIPLPEFVDAGWLKRHVTLTARDVRLLHAAHAETFSEVLGLPWPAERPSVDATYGLLVEGLRHPYFWRHLLHAFGEIRRHKLKLLDGVLRKFFLKNSALDNKKTDKFIMTSVTFAGGRSIAEYLQRGGDPDAARAMAVLEWACRKDVPDDAEEAVAADAALKDYVAGLLSCKSALNAAKIDGLLIARKMTSPALSDDRPPESLAAPHPPSTSREVASLPPGRESVQAQWTATMARLVARAGSLAAATPDEAIAADLATMAGELCNLAAMHGALPATPEPAAAILDRLRGTAAALDRILGAIGTEDGESLLAAFELAMIEASPDAGPEACAASIDAADAAESRLREAEAAHAALSALEQDPALTWTTRLEQASRFVANGQQAAEAGLRAATEAARALVDETVRRPAPIPPRPEPIAAPPESPAAAAEPAPARPAEHIFSPVNGVIATAPLPDTVRSTPPPLPAEEESEIAKGLDRLVQRGSFGLAYHLAQAALRLAPDASAVPWSTAELHLAAVAGRLTAAPERDIESWQLALMEAIDVAQALSAAPASPRTNARRVLLFASVLPAALLPGGEERLAREIIAALGPSGACSPFFDLVGALDENQRRDYPLNAATLREARQGARALLVEEKLRTAIRTQIDVMRNNRADIGFEGKIKTWLRRREGAVGRLVSGLDGPDPTAAAAGFVEAIGEREKALAAIEIARREVNHGHHAPLDGSLREALVASLLKLADLCRDLVAMPPRPQPGSAAAGAQRLRGLVRDALVRACETSPRPSDPLPEAAWSHARAVLARMRDLIDGTEAAHDPLAAPLALHAPLLGLGGLFRNSGWQPSATPPATLVTAILAASAEASFPIAADAFATVVSARQAEGSFVGAHVLLSLADRCGVSRDTAEHLRSSLVAEEDIRRDQLARKLAEAGRLIEKVRRAASGRSEAIEGLQGRLKIVRPERLPVAADPAIMPDIADAGPIGDFNEAHAFVADIVREARALLDREKAALSERIMALDTLDEDRRRSLVALRDADDLVTLSDWLLLFEGPEADRPVPGEGVVNRRLDRFCTRLETIAGIEIRSALEAIQDGKDYQCFPFSTLEAGRRDEAEAMLGRWIALKREARAGDASAQSVAQPLTGLLTAMIAEARLLNVDPITARTRGVYAVDIKMTVTGTPSSLLLPDFGSGVRGRWRVVVTSAVPAATEIVRLASGTGEDRGVLVVVLGTLTRDQRRHLKVECVKSACKVLVIDEALLLETLGDPQSDRLAVLEIAQGFTVATPYRDYANQPVPPEMFKGRLKEQNEIQRPFGSSIVYGGRRLGKTALLRHIERLPRPAGAVYVRVDLSTLISSDDLWEKLSGALPEVFPQGPLRTPEGFERRVRDWLDADGDGRRILLMLDEADNFIHDQGDAHAWRHVHVLMRLMDGTADRFKIVLAGLHNVSRIARGDNHPLARLSASAIEIGPLSGAEARDAEALIRGPLAAMGYEFERREDVWRILSATIYYPVLIQIFCRELLRLIHERIHSANEPIRRIGPGLVEAALANRGIRDRLGETFNKTIRNIEGRYELLTCLLTRDALLRETASPAEDGMRIAEIADAASRCWPAAFPQGPEPLEIARLLDEMRGFGLARRVEGDAGGDRWALRSRMLIDLMACSGLEQIEARLAGFGRLPFEHQFDPPNLRRLLAGGSRPSARAPTSPLTESDVALVLRPGNQRRGVMIFGPPVADLDVVVAAIEAARTGPDAAIGFRRMGPAQKPALLASLAKVRSETPLIAAIGPETPWRPDWVVEALALACVAEGRVRPVFVGGPEHAAAYAADETARTGIDRVAIITLRPWTRSYLAARLDPLLDTFAPDLVERIMQVTGGWNAPCSALLAEGEPPNTERLGRCQARLSGDETMRRLGVASERSEMSAVLGEAAGAAPAFETVEDLADYCELLTPAADPVFVRTYAGLMGLFRVGPDGRIQMNPLAATVFGQRGAP